MNVSFCSKEKVLEVCGSIYHYMSFKIMESINALSAIFSDKKRNTHKTHVQICNCLY